MKPSKPPKQSTGELILASLPATRKQLLSRVGVSETTLHKWITRLKGMQKVHVGSHVRTIGDIAEVIVLGPGEDAPRPLARSGAVVQRKYRRKMREEERAALRRRNEAVEQAKEARYMNDPLMAALFGRRG